MRLKSITVIAVLLLVIASLLVAGCTTSTTNQTTTPSTAERLPTYPFKRLWYSSIFGGVKCEPNGPQYGQRVIPTDGSGTTTWYSCAGVPSVVSTGTSNQQGYLVTNGYHIVFHISAYMAKNYTKELSTRGAGNTEMDLFKKTYVDLANKLGLKWWADISDIMSSQDILTYQTPGYDSPYYTPASGIASSYEALFGPAFDFIEHNCSTGFQGYVFENAYQNGVQWLHDRTPYCVSEEDWSAFGGWFTNFPETDNRGVNLLRGTKSDGTEFVATPLQRIGLLDELSVEIYRPTFYTAWSNYLPTVTAAYPNLPIVINVDQVCADMQWANGAPLETGRDSGWWAPAGVGEPNHRCAAEEAAAIQQITSIYNILGKPFSGMNCQFYHAVYPVNGPTYPDITWFLQWADTLHVTS
jgi:hypothetical protein